MGIDQNGTETTTILSAQVPTHVRDELMHLARRHDRSMSAEIRSAVRAYISRGDAETVADPPEDFSAMTSSRAPAGDAVPAGVEPPGKTHEKCPQAGKLAHGLR